MFDMAGLTDLLLITCGGMWVTASPPPGNYSQLLLQQRAVAVGRFGLRQRLA